MQDKIEQAVDEFLNGEHSIDDCVVIWEQLADEVQNGDQDVAIKQAGRIAGLTNMLVWNETQTGCCGLSARTVLSFVRAFTPVVEERGMLEDDDAG